MRRLLSLTIVLLCLCCAVPTALAASAKTYDLPELNLTIDAPEGWYAFTQDVKEDDPDLKLLGIDGKGLADQYKENGIYLDMRSGENNNRIKVNMSLSDDAFVYDFNDMSDEELQLLAYEMQDQTFTLCSVYTHKQAKFAVFNYFDQLNYEKTLYGKAYLTVINGQEISIMLQSVNEISGSLEQTIKSTVDSIAFTKVTSKPVPAAAVLDSTHELPELNMTMRSPKDWYVFTQDVDKDDPELKHLIRTYGERIADFYEQKGSCLYMISPDDHAEIYVTQCSQSIHDFNDLSDKDLLLLATKIWRLHGRLAVYKHKQAKFVLNYTGIYIQCLTVINGQAISVIMGSLGTIELSDNLAPMLINVVDSITFTNVTPKPSSKKVTYELAGLFADLNMTIDVSGSWYVEDYGFGLDMLSTDPDAKVTVDMTNSDVGSFADMTDEDLLQSATIKKNMERYKQSEGNVEKAAYSDYSVYAQKQTKFVTCDFTQLKDSKTVYGKKYYTVTDWGAIEVTLYSNESGISDNLEQALKSMVNSITFKKAPEQVDDYVAVLASITGAVMGAIIGSAVITIRKRRMAY